MVIPAVSFLAPGQPNKSRKAWPTKSWFRVVWSSTFLTVLRGVTVLLTHCFSSTIDHFCCYILSILGKIMAETVFIDALFLRDSWNIFVVIFPTRKYILGKITSIKITARFDSNSPIWNLRTTLSLLKRLYYIDTDEIPGFLLLQKDHIFTARSEDTIKIVFSLRAVKIWFFYVWGYWLPNYNSASRSGARSVDLKFHSQNGLKVQRR